MTDPHAPQPGPAPLLLKLNPLTLLLKGLQVIEASAGTGKTWTLSALYVRLVLDHVPAGCAPAVGLYPPQILVMTFTDAATAELRGRIRERLSQAANFFRHSRPGQADDFLRALRSDLGADRWPACANRLDMTAQWMDDAAIFTIHGWSSRMLKTHAFDSASLFQQSRVEDSDRPKLIAVQDYWRKWFYTLSPEQLGALQAIGQTPDELFDKLGALWSVQDKAPQAHDAPAQTPVIVVRAWETWHAQRDALELLARPAWSPEIVAQLQEAAASKAIKGYRADWLAGWLSQMQAWAQGGEIKPETLQRFTTSRLLEKGWPQAGEHPVFAHLEALHAHLLD